MGVYMTHLDIFETTSKRLSPKRLKFVNFSSYPIDALKKIAVNNINTSYDDVIIKNRGANFTVKFLLNSKMIEMLLDSHLSKIFTLTECYL